MRTMISSLLSCPVSLCPCVPVSLVAVSSVVRRSAASDRVQLAIRSFAGQDAPHLLRRMLAQLVFRPRARPGDVRRENDAALAHEVVILRQRLDGEGVERGAGDLAVAQGGDERGLVDDSAAA